MKRLPVALLFAAAASAAFAETPAPMVAPVTLQDEIELYSAITSLDRGTTKVIDGKPQQVPYTFSGPTRFALSIDAGLVKAKAEAYQNTALSVRSRLDPKSTNDNASVAAVSAELNPVFSKVDASPPTFQKIPLADLNLDANPIPFDTLTKLKLIIQQ